MKPQPNRKPSPSDDEYPEPGDVCPTLEALIDTILRSCDGQRVTGAVVILNTETATNTGNVQFWTPGVLDHPLATIGVLDHIKHVINNAIIRRSTPNLN